MVCNNESDCEKKTFEVNKNQGPKNRNKNVSVSKEKNIKTDSDSEPDSEDESMFRKISKEIYQQLIM